MSFTDRYSVSNTMLDNGNSNSDCIAGTSEQHIQRRVNCAQLENRGAASAIHDTNCVYTQLSIQPIEQLFGKLYESLALETKYQPSLVLPEDSNNGEITVGARDGAAHVLRCLKMWYDFPSDVLFSAVNLVDRFLTKMRVRPKHMACISVGSFLLASRQLKLNIADTDDLVCISQCRCTSGDVERMSTIVSTHSQYPFLWLLFCFYLFIVDLFLCEFEWNVFFVGALNELWTIIVFAQISDCKQTWRTNGGSTNHSSNISTHFLYHFASRCC